MIKRTLRWILTFIVIAIIADGLYLAVIWPNWDLYDSGPIRQSKFISDYAQKKLRDKTMPPLKWQPVPITTVPRHMVRAVIVAEDSKFYQHKGFDVEAIKTAVEHNLSDKKGMFGASTISQQTVKNMFLSPSRNPLRKWHEVVLTVGMEHNLRKRRILELYLNVAEFGRGIYGVEAAARHYWGISVSEISPQQAAELAATLPSPVKNNPHTRTKFFDKKYKRIIAYMQLPTEAAVPISTTIPNDLATQSSLPQAGIDATGQMDDAADPDSDAEPRPEEEVPMPALPMLPDDDSGRMVTK